MYPTPLEGKEGRRKEKMEKKKTGAIRRISRFKRSLKLFLVQEEK